MTERSDPGARPGAGSGSPLASDLLIGLNAIASYLGISLRRTQYMTERGRIPVFKRGKLVMARRSEIDRALRADSVDGTAA